MGWVKNKTKNKLHLEVSQVAAHYALISGSYMLTPRCTSFKGPFFSSHLSAPLVKE